MRRVLVMAMAGALGASAAGADVVILKGGGRIEGEIVEQRADSVVIDVSAGRVTLPRTRIERMVVGRSALAEYRARAARLAAGDLAGWLALANWASENDLTTQSRSAYEHVLAVDPGNVAARQALGHVFAGGRWMTADESFRARGYVQFEGSWLRPEERQALRAERAAEEAQRRELMEADARVREAEARARAAEAEADRLESEQQQPAVDDGIPYPWVFGGGIVPVRPHSRHEHRQPPTVIVVHPRPPQPAPRPTPPPPARSPHAGHSNGTADGSRSGGGH
jgi:hypothetical protein